MQVLVVGQCGNASSCRICYNYMLYGLYGDHVGEERREKGGGLELI